MYKNNDDYVTVEENDFENKSTAIQQYYFGDRVDMTDSMSILNYGKEIIDEISKLRDSLYIDESSEKIGESLTSIQDKISEVSNFNTELDEQDAKREKLEKRQNTLIGKLITKVVGEAAFAARDSYKDALEKQNDIVELISENVQANAQAAAEAHRYNKDYLIKLEEKLKELKQLIDYGHEDCDEFTEQINLMEKNGPSENDDEVLFENKINQARKHILLFEQRLASLDSVRVATGQLFATTVQKQTVYGQLMQQLYDVDSTLLPILRSTAKEAIDTRRQNEMLKMSQAIINGTNEAIIKNAQQVKSNVELSQKMMQEGTLHTSTLVTVGKTIEDAAKIIANGRQQLNKALEDRIRVNAQMDASLNNAIKVMKLSIEADTTESTLLQGIKLPELPTKQESPKMKKLGKAPNIGNN